jgi:hypothetical protein
MSMDEAEFQAICAKARVPIKKEFQLVTEKDKEEERKIRDAMTQEEKAAVKSKKKFKPFRFSSSLSLLIAVIQFR